CSAEAGTVLDDVFKKDQLLNFVSTVAKHLLAVKEMLEKINGALASDDLTKVTEDVNKASTSLGSAQSACAPPSCPQDVKDKLGSLETDLKQLGGSTEVGVSDKFDKLKKTLEEARGLGELPTSNILKEDMENSTKGVMKKLEELGGRLNKSIGQLKDSVKAVVESVRKASASVDDPPGEVNTALSVYAIFATVVAIIITVIVGIYVFNAASWTMVVAVLVFLISFPIFMVASSFGTTAGLSIDRKVCAPAMDLGASSSRPFVEFLAGKLGTQKEASHHRSAALREDNAKQGGASSSESRRLVATSGSGTRRLRRVASPKHHRDHTKRRRVPARGSKSPESAQRFETREHGKAARRRRGQRPRGDDHGADDAGGVAPPADIASALDKELTPKALEGVLERFAQCSQTGLSFFKLLGKDLMTDLARAYLGQKSPWLGIFDDSAGAPKFDALENLGTKFPSVPDALEKTLKDIEPATTIDVTEFETISTKAKNAKEEFVKFGDMRTELQGYVHNAGPAAAGLQQTIDALDDIWGQRKAAYEAQMDVIDGAAQNLTKDFMVGSKPLGTYIADNLPNWNAMKSGSAASKKKVLQMGEKAKAAFNSDLLLFFDHVKEQVRDHIGDCRPLYVLYLTTVETACNQGVSLLAAFWCSVWWFLVLGIPAVVVALMLSTYFARAVIQKEGTNDEAAKGDTSKG
ncbi:hypothetical protein MTO96_037927, partial [Rhipicephalus appendiculatus]